MKNTENTGTPAENTTGTPTVTPKVKQAIMRSLGAGLVPHIGLRHLVVGRKPEIKALTSDLDTIKEGGATFRIILGHNGNGKTFLEHVVREQAVQSGLVVLAAELTVSARLHSTDGRSRALYTALMTSVCTKACPSGNGLRSVLESFISTLQFDTGNETPTPEAMEQRIKEQLRTLKDYPGGFEFATVLARYYEGHVNDNPALQDAALRWLRAEYSTKTEAKQDLGVRRIIADEDIYPALKLFTAFCKLAGHAGVLVMLDELSAIVRRLPHARARETNVQVLLTIINDCFQGGASGLGFLLAGTPDTLEDQDRGLFTVPALRSRLQICAPGGHIDYASPVLRLTPLGQEELLVLLHNVRRVHALGDESRFRLPDEALNQFLDRALSRFGRKAVANPRDVLRPFFAILNILDQEPEQRWEDLVERVMVESAPTSDAAATQLGSLKLQ